MSNSPFRGKSRREVCAALGKVMAVGAITAAGLHGWAEGRPMSSEDFIGSLIGALRKANAELPAGRPRREAMRGVIERSVDIDGIGRRSLGDNWNALDDEIRQSFLLAYRSYFLRDLSRYLSSSEDTNLTPLGTRSTGTGQEVVIFRSSQNGRQHDIYWYLKTIPSYVVTDLGVDGLLLSAQHLQEFEAILRANNGDFSQLPGAIDRLNP